MYLPQSYQVALLFMVASMLCWGSWANTMKLCPGHRFQLFYWDYIIGLFAGTLLFGATLGSAGTVGFPFLPDIQNASRASIAYAIAGGAVFNIANLLLVAAIEVAGMAVAFPVGIGLALVIGVIVNYVAATVGNGALLAMGVVLVTLAIVLDALAYRRLSGGAAGVSTKGL